MTTSQSPDPAGLFSKDLVPSVYPSIIPQTPAVDTHRSDADVWNLNSLHKANNCNNCLHFFAGKCDVHKYQMPYREIECEQWESRGKRA